MLGAQVRAPQPCSRGSAPGAPRQALQLEVVFGAGSAPGPLPVNVPGAEAMGMVDVPMSEERSLPSPVPALERVLLPLPEPGHEPWHGNERGETLVLLGCRNSSERAFQSVRWEKPL